MTDAKMPEGWESWYEDAAAYYARLKGRIAALEHEVAESEHLRRDEREHFERLLALRDAKIAALIEAGDDMRTWCPKTGCVGWRNAKALPVELGTKEGE